MTVSRESKYLQINWALKRRATAAKLPIEEGRRNMGLVNTEDNSCMHCRELKACMRSSKHSCFFIISSNCYLLIWWEFQAATGNEGEGTKKETQQI